MRIFRGLENIHSVIDRHESEWRRDNGEETEHIRRPSIEEAVRRRLTARQDEGSGMFAADRFLGGSTDPLKRKRPEPVNLTKPEPEPESVSIEPEINIEPETIRHSWLYNEVMKAVNSAAAGSDNTKVVAVFVPVIQSEGVAREIPADSDALPDDGENVRAVEIIRNKDGRHSRLYDEVMKAVNDAAGDSRRIVAVFVPLLQDGGEFEDLPADETITLSPVSEDDVKVEAVADVVPDAEPIIPETETLPEIITPETDSAPEITDVIPETQDTAPEPEPEITEEIPMPDTDSESAILDSIPEPETVQEIIIPETQDTAPESEPEITEEIFTPDTDTEPAIVDSTPEPETVGEILTPDAEPVIVEEITAPQPGITEEIATPEPETAPEIITPEPEIAEEIFTPEPETDAETPESPEPEITADIPETESELEAQSNPEDFDLIPEVQPELDPELAEAYREIKQKLDEASQQEITGPENETDDDDDILQDGEPMVFEELDDIGRNDADNIDQTEELVLPDELDDDEINDDFDETLTEIHLPDDDDEEIEIVPDPEN